MHIEILEIMRNFSWSELKKCLLIKRKSKIKAESLLVYLVD